MKKNYFLPTIWFFLAAFFFLPISCGKKTKEDKIILNVLVGSGQALGAQIEQRTATKFEKLNPGIDVRMNVIKQSYQPRLMTILAGGSVPDVFFVHGSLFQELIKKGVFYNMDNFVKKDKIDFNRYHDSGIKIYYYKDSLYGLPRDLSPIMLFYNKKLFTEAGISYPDHWTWDDVIKGGRKFNNYKKSIGANKYFYSIFFQNDLFLQNEAYVFDDPVNPTRVTLFDNDNFEETIDFILQLKDEDIIPDINDSAGSSIGGFEGEGYAMKSHGTWRTADYFAALKEDLGLSRPLKKKRRTSIGGTGCYSIHKETKQAEAAWKFIKFTCYESRGVHILAKRLTPAIPAAVQSKHYLPYLDKDEKKAIVETQKKIRFHQTFYNNEFKRRFSDIVDGITDKTISKKEGFKQMKELSREWLEYTKGEAE